MIEAFRSFLAWWRRELAGLASLFPFGSVRRLVLSLDPAGGLTVSEERRGRVKEIARFGDAFEAPVSRSQQRRLRAWQRRADEVVLRLPDDAVLRPRVRLVADDVGELEPALRREMDRQTPFPSEDVRFDWRVVGSDDELEAVEVEMLVARRAEVERAYQASQALGLVPDRIDAAGDEEPRFNLLPERPYRARWFGTVIRPLALTVLLLAAAWLFLAIDRREADLASLDERLVDLRARAADARSMDRRIEALETAAGALEVMKQTRPPVVVVLAEVTERLPDDTWLNTLRLENNRLVLGGFSANASRLLARLEASPYFGKVAFGAPVSRDERSDTDDFIIEAQVTSPAVSQ